MLGRIGLGVIALVAGGLGACTGGQAGPVPTVVVPVPAPAPSASPIAEGEMVRVPAASFAMGADDGASFPEERPVHRVTVESFEIDLSEVTVAAYQGCVDAGRCSPAGSLVEGPEVEPAERELLSQFCIGNRGDRPGHPVNCVDHAQASAYCAFAGKRLPTEAEWELAARGHGSRPFPWGTESPDPELCNACDAQCARGFQGRGAPRRSMFPGGDGFETTAPVRSFPEGRSPFGVFDLAGNVWEWTSSPGCAYAEPACDAPTRIRRGGGWLDGDPRMLRASARIAAAPETRSVDLGFRCAR